jgi:predicted Zn-dependent peptidase
MNYYHHQLNNGLTMVGEHDANARSLAMGYFVRTGSRDETAQVNGVSHFLEHMMFKGTDRRSADDVNREFDEMGARYNAFTSEENTVYYGNVLPQFQGKLQALLSDMMRPALREDDFNMEKNVILEEIAMYWDRPQFRVFEQLRESYYGGHPLGASILGSAQSIRDLTAEQMRTYFSQRYAANNLTFVLAGNFDWEKACVDAEKWCANWNTDDVPRALSAHQASAKVERIADDKTNRAHIALMAPGFSAQNPLRLAAEVAAEAIGAGDGSRLYWALVHPGIAEAAQLGHDANDGDGAFYGYLLADPERAAQALETFKSVLAEACRDGLNEAEVERAKRRLASHVLLGSETPMGRLRPLGMDQVYRKKYRSAQDLLAQVQSVSLDEVNNLLDESTFETATVVILEPGQGNEQLAVSN